MCEINSSYKFAPESAEIEEIRRRLGNSEPNHSHRKRTDVIMGPQSADVLKIMQALLQQQKG